MDIRSTLETMSKDQLIDMMMSMGVDRAFGIMSRNMAETFYGSIEAGKTLIMVDIANMHAMNHLYSMDGVDQRIKAVTDVIRHSDLVIRWGGDELVIVLNSGNVEDYIARLDTLMHQNDLYAVIGSVITSESLAESVKRADAIVMQTKLMLEETGQKPNRDEAYRVLPSVIVYA